MQISKQAKKKTSKTKTAISYVILLARQSVWRYKLTKSAGKRTVSGRQWEKRNYGARENTRENNQLTKSNNLASTGCMCPRASHHLLNFSRMLGFNLVYHTFTFALSVTS